MAGLQGQDRAPQAPVRERRNFDNLNNALEFIGPGEVIGISGDGFFVLKIKDDSGLANDAGELAVLLDPTNPGLVLNAAGIAALVQGVLDIDASGILVNIGNGLENAASALAVALAANPGLEFATGDLRVQLDGGTLTRGASGLSVTAPEGQPSVTAVKTSVYTAALGEYVRYDATSGTFAITLPTAAGHNRALEFKEAANDATGVTLTAAGAELIDGAGTLAVGSAREHTRLVSDGVGWMIS
jgi:hypothetical protein